MVRFLVLKIQNRKSETWRFVVVLAAIVLGEMTDLSSLHRIRFCGSKHLIRRGLVGVILEVDSFTF